MPSLNHVQLIGRLGRDPEPRFTPNGKKAVRFSLAVSQHWKTKDGEARESTEWVNIEAWGRLGEVCEQYLHKGSLIFIEGRLKTDRYDDSGGDTRYFTKIVAQSMQMLDQKPGDETAAALEEASEDEA